jgi:hypothetical protein
MQTSFTGKHQGFTLLSCHTHMLGDCVVAAALASRSRTLQRRRCGVVARRWLPSGRPRDVFGACLQHPNVGVPSTRLDGTVSSLVAHGWKVIVVDQVGTGESGGVFGSAAGRAVRTMATPGTHIADPFSSLEASDGTATAEQQALEAKPRRLLSITAKKSVSAASTSHSIGICVYEPALSQYRVWEWIEDKRWQMLFTVLAETSPVELCIDSGGDFPRTLVCSISVPLVCVDFHRFVVFLADQPGPLTRY